MAKAIEIKESGLRVRFEVNDAEDHPGGTGIPCFRSTDHGKDYQGNAWI